MSDVLVLCYHAVSPTWVAELSVTPEAFESQIGYLLARGWRGVTFSEAVLAPSAERTLAITFDDAFASVFKHAKPILTDFGVPATVFAPTAFVDVSGPLVWTGIDQWQATPSAPELEVMSWEQLGQLCELGWEIGSHTRTHPELTQLDDELLTVELGQSREDCERRLGRPCRAIAYPYGDVDARVEKCARTTGYVVGAAMSSALTHLGPHRHPRVGIYHGDGWLRFRLKASRRIRKLRATRLWSLRG